MAFRRTLRLRFLEVAIMRRGAERMMANERNCIGEMVSPRKSQPKIKYRTGASWRKIPRLVELSFSRTL